MQRQSLSEQERQQVLYEWNATTAEYPTDRCLHHFVEHQAAAAPQRVAVVCGESQLSYKELNERANQLARFLHSQHGVRPGVRVALCVQRSLDMLVAIMGILKAGGAYVPLSPAYPQERIAFILKDCGAPLLLTQESLRGSLPTTAATTLFLEELQAALHELAADNPSYPVSATDAAYAIYTSGSTGRPKGVLCEHRGAYNTAAAHIDWCKVRPDDRLLQFAAFGFDTGILDMLMALGAGATLCLVPQDQLLVGEGLLRLLAQSHISIVALPPSVIGSLPEAPLPELRIIISCGEACTEALARRWSVGRQFWNGYGPTEGSICATLGLYDAQDGVPTIGRALPNTRIYILDEERQPVAIGAPGELYIGGIGVAREYLGRPELTAERFLADPFVPGGRMYRTGDRARFAADGRIDFLGRLDDQVKIRGFRVEPGEIEAVLLQEPGVKQCAVLAREDEPGDKRLVAYVVAHADAKSSPAQLRDSLREKLPAFMIPAAFVWLPALPLTTHGKIDRASLPAPARTRPALATEYVAPRNELETTLAAIFAEALRVDEVGVHDDFFALGGHSLRAAQAVAQLGQQLQVEVPLRALFHHPTIAGLAAHLSSDRPPPSAAGTPALVRAHRAAALPLSSSQEQVWLTSQLDEQCPLYNEPYALTVRGALDADVLEAALRSLVDRHEILRTGFEVMDGTPAQKVHDRVDLLIPRHDLRSLDEAARAAALHHIHQELARRPFELHAPPLLRAGLVRLGEDEHRLLLTLHHAIFDGVSLSGVLLPELAQLYRAGGVATGLPACEFQYGDYAVWERAQLTSAALASDLAYWRRQLADLPTLQLPTDKPRSASTSFRGIRHPLHLRAELADSLTALAQREGATLYMALLTAFTTLLHRYTGQDDFPVAGVLSTQGRPQLRGLIGPFVNTVVLRMDLSRQLTFLELLRQVRETVLGAVEHQGLPFAKLVEALRPGRRVGQHPLFQVLFLLDPPGPELPPGWSVSRFDAHNGTAMCELSLQLERRAEGLVGFIEYSSDLLEPATIARWSHHLEVLLGGIVAEPDAALCDLPLLPVHERAQLASFSSSARDFAATACLHELFAAQARRTPDAVALRCDQTTLTYAELDRRANRLAARLRALGVGPDAPVGLCSERSPELLIGILGILKAGGAYLPLDPVYPRERIGFLLSDSGAQVVVIQPQTRQSLPSAYTGTVVSLDELPEGDDAAFTQPTAAFSADQLAYIIYTSGSTGKPKGVQVSHRNVVRLFSATEHWFHFDASDVWCLFHSFAFDFSVWELWGALLYGGRLVIVPYWVSRSPEAFCRLLRAEAVTVLNQTPSAFYQLMAAEQVDSAKNEQPLALRWVIFGGEALDLGALLPWLQRHGEERPRLVNMYGITETTVHVTYHPITRADCEQPGSVIGVPIPDLRVRVLDRHLRLAPLGIPGELFVGGAGVARGYLNRPELTTLRFLSDPYGAASDRLYRSGDWVRYRPDGRLEYLGRIDHQVKIRGFRIELGEIEEALLQHPDLQAAVVLAREDTPGDRRIIAYVVPRSGPQQGLAARVRSFVEQKLPSYMVPAHLVVMEALPLTPNGKVDRRALPAPDHARPELRAEYVAPRTFLEEELAGIFAEVLSIEQVGVNDSFFDLGGHSLLVIRVIFRVREIFHVELPMRAVFDAPTVAGLARHLSTLQPNHRDLEVPPIVAQPRGVRSPLSFAQQRLWFLAQLLPDAPSYNEPVTVRFGRSIHAGNAAVLEQALAEILRRHEAWRTTFQSADGEPFQVVHPPAPLKLPIADLRMLPSEAREVEFMRLCTSEAHRPFNLVEGPLIRFMLLLLTNEDSRLFIAFHHIVADGLSIYSVFNVELARLVRAFAAGQPSPLPPLPIQYADFALWQRRWLSSDVVERQLAYWRQKLGPQVPVLKLPIDHAAPQQPTFRGARQIVSLPRELTQQLRRLGHREGATLFITLLTAIKALLHRYVEQPEIVIGIVTAGRQRPELTPLLGFFPNTLVLRTVMSGDPSFRELLRRVREVTLQAFDNQDVPFERVVEALNPERRPGEMPLFRVGFILDPLAPELGNEWAMTSTEVEIAAAKFDLGLELVDVPEGVTGRISYRTELFEPATIQRMALHYTALLQSAASDPDQPLSRIKLLTEMELAQLSQWAAPRAPLGEPLGVHQRFEAQVDLSPDAPALLRGDEIISYGALEQQANQIAHALRARGVRAETLVGLCATRSPLQVAGMLGILKAGGAFLALDPAYPRDRLAFMLSDAGIDLLLSERALTEQLPAPAGETLLFDEPEWYADSPSARLRTEDVGRQLAYVIYTSGSTGRPKGVLIEHHSLCNSIAAQADLFGTGPHDRVLQFASPGFDVAVFEIMLALTRGAALVLPPQTGLLPGPELISLLREHEVTTLAMTASALAVLPLEPLPKLRTLIAGGEALPQSLVERWLVGHRHRRMYNAYGPTEATICVTIGDCQVHEETPPIGRPLANTQVHILDEYLQPVPIGIAGELYIGGVGVARGYLARPELTAERFVTSPFAAQERLYRTGDRARWRQDGQLEFLGRVDSQVKLRGFRIELGEIDAVLASHPDVREAAVVARMDGGEHHLVAYIVAAEPAPTTAELRSHLAQTLPQYMVPALIVPIAELPRTANGKTDRRALAQSELPLPAPPAVEYRPPESDLEQSLVAIWQEVLNLQHVGVNDTFFDLGGHSLRMAQVQARLREVLGRAVPLLELFKYPTIRALATFLQGEVETDKPSSSLERGRLRKEAAALNRRRAAERKKQDE